MFAHRHSGGMCTKGDRSRRAAALHALSALLAGESLSQLQGSFGASWAGPRHALVDSVG